MDSEDRNAETLADVSRGMHADVALNLLHGAAVLARVQALRSQGVAVPAEASRLSPIPGTDLEELLR